MFQVTYGKYTTNILTLITPALNREIILSWRALQRLGVIPKDFPKPRLSQQWQFDHVTKSDHVTINKTSTPPPLPKSHDDNKETKKNQETADQETNTATADDDIDLHELVDELKKKYESVFNVDSELKTMTGEPMRIELVDNVTIKPLHVNVPHRTPYAYQKIAKAELDRLVELGILEKVSGSSD